MLVRAEVASLYSVVGRIERIRVVRDRVRVGWFIWERWRTTAKRRSSGVDKLIKSEMARVTALLDVEASCKRSRVMRDGAVRVRGDQI